MKSKRINWIDIIKVVCCIGVFNSHFWRLFAFSQMGGREFNMILGELIQKLLNVFFNGATGVCIFSVLCGYLASEKSIDSFSKLCKSIVNRYIKFVLPFAIMVGIIWGLDLVVGFRITEYNSILGTEEIGQSPVINPTNIIKTVFLFDEVMNIPLWMFKSLYVASCMVFCWNYICYKLRISRAHTWFLTLLVFILLYVAKYFVHGNFYILACCMSGVLIKLIWESMKKLPDWLKWSVVVLWITAQTIWGKIPVFIFSYVLLCILGSLNYKEKNAKWMQTLDEASLYVYLYHDLIIGSITLGMYSVFIHYLSYTQTVCVLWILTSLILGIFVAAYMLTMRQIENKLIKILKV